MSYWRWNPHLSTAELREQVLRDLLHRTSQNAAGPSCPLLPELRHVERGQHRQIGG